MGQKQFITLTAPAYWATALVNNDYSGLQSPDAIEDLVALYRFLKRERPLEIIDVKRNRRGEAMDSYFSWSFGLHGGTRAGGDLLDYVATRQVLNPSGQLTRARRELMEALARRRAENRETAPV